MSHAIADGLFTLAQFLVPALVITWADRPRRGR